MSKKSSLLVRYLFRNKMILNDYNRKTKHNSVNLHWWSPYGSEAGKTECENLGDYLAVPILDFMKEKNEIKSDKSSKTKHLYTVGSITFMGLQNAVIWGSGLLFEDRLPKLVTKNPFNKPIIKLDIRSVRGPETRRVLKKWGYDCPEIYGDPAILLPLIYRPKVEKKRAYTVIHHMGSDDSKEGLSILTTDYKSFINRIVESEFVISGSLHGIILAEAYNVPAILLLDRENINLFKYRDYYYSTGRYEFPIARSVEEACQMEKAPLPTNLAQMQNNLLNAFPVDLWDLQ